MAPDHGVTELCLGYNEKCWDNGFPMDVHIKSQVSKPLFFFLPTVSEVAFCWVGSSAAFLSRCLAQSRIGHSDFRYWYLCSKPSLAHQQISFWHIFMLSQLQIWSSYVPAALVRIDGDL